MNLLPEAAEYLRRRVAEALSARSVSPYFGAWLLPDMVDLETLRTEAVLVSARIGGAQRTYHDVADLAFASECQLLEAAGFEALGNGLRWMSGRTPRMEGSPADFCADPCALLGLALAIRRMKEDTKCLSWFENATAVAAQHVKGWHGSVVALAQHVARGCTGGIGAPDVQIVGFSKNLLEDKPSETTLTGIANGLRSTVLSTMDDLQCAFGLAALREVERSAPRITAGHATVAEVVAVLRAIPSGLQRWTWEQKAKTSATEPRKWHVDHEYHVQNLVWLLLSPLFPDARYEENKSAVGQVHPRFDIVIPSLRLIVEIKFWRKSIKAEQMIRELAEDASLYLTADVGYTSIVPFIWDDAARTEEHPLLISGLKELRGISDAVIVSRPARMSG